MDTTKSRRSRAPARALGLALVVLAGALASVPAPVAADGKPGPAHVERGEASFYGPGFHGRRTASGERFDRRRLTAAHPRLPLGSRAVVTNLENGRRVEVEVNDRGPYAKGRVIDLSEAAARRIGITREEGTAPVLIVVASAR
jgi:rare lipoprotein A